MTTSKIGLDLIKKWESLHDGDLSMIGLQPKMCPAGIWTEGYGKAMKFPNGSFVKGKENKEYAFSHITIHNKEEAEKDLILDLKAYERIVAIKIKVELNQNQFDALVSHTYNTGGSETLFKLINGKAPKETIQSWWTKRYITANGVQLKGLINRRKDEYNLFIAPVV